MVSAADSQLTSQVGKIEVAIAAVNDAPVIAAAVQERFYTEGDAALALLPAFQFGDVDSSGFARVQVTLADAQQTDRLSLDELSLSSLTGISLSTIQGTLTNGIVTLSVDAPRGGSLSTGQVEAILGAVRYASSAGDALADGTRALTVSVTDAQGAQGSWESVVRLVGVNDAPVVALTPNRTPTYTEGAAPLAPLQSVVLSDPDAAGQLMASARVKITTNARLGDDRLSLDAATLASLPPALNVVFDAEQATLTIHGQASLATYQRALAGLRYSNSSDNPLAGAAGARVLQFTLTDAAGASSAPAQLTLNVVAVDDLPVLNLGGNQDYTRAVTPSQAVFEQARLSDVDSPSLAGIRITGSAGDAFSLSSFATQEALLANVTVNQSVDRAGNAVLTLTGAAVAPARFESILHGVLFDNANSAQLALTGAKSTLTVAVLGDAGAALVNDTLEVLHQQTPLAAIARGSSTLTLSGTTAYSELVLDLASNAFTAGGAAVAVAGDKLFTASNVNAQQLLGQGLTIFGRAEANRIDGSEQNDWIAGGGGADTIRAGGGDDTVVYASSATLDGGSEVDTLLVVGSFDAGQVSAVTGFENLDASQAKLGVNLVGFAGSGKVTGSAFADTVDGGGGDDTIAGGAGKDLLVLRPGTQIAAGDLAIGDTLLLAGQTLTAWRGRQDSGSEVNVGAAGIAPTAVRQYGNQLWVKTGAGANDLVFYEIGLTEAALAKLGDPAGWAIAAGGAGSAISGSRLQLRASVEITSMAKDTGASDSDFITRDGSAGREIAGRVTAALAPDERVEVLITAASVPSADASWSAAQISGLGWSYFDASAHPADWNIFARIVSGTGSALEVRSALAQRTVDIDVAPAEVLGVTYGANDGALAAGEAIDLTVQFDESVLLDGDALTLALGNGGIATYQAGSGSASLVFAYTPALANATADASTADLTTAASAALKLGLGTTLVDRAGNTVVFTGANGLNPAGVVVVDAVAPAVALSSTLKKVQANEVALIMLAFTEDPGSSFGLEDLALAGETLGTLSSVAGEGLTRTVTFTPNMGVTGQAVIRVESGTFADAAGNPNADGFDADNQVALAVDTQGATVTAANFGVANAAASGIFKRGETLNLRWDNSATGDHNEDVATVVIRIAPSGVGTSTGTGTPAAPTVVALDDADGDGIWTGSIAVNALPAQQGDAAVSIAVTDRSNNVVALVDDTAVKVDNVVPTLLGVTRTEGATAADPVAFTLHFSEAVQGMDLSSTAILARSGVRTSDLSLSVLRANLGDLTIGLAQVADLAGNPFAGPADMHLLLGTKQDDLILPSVANYGMILGAGDDETLLGNGQNWLYGDSGFDTIYLPGAGLWTAEVATDPRTGLRSFAVVSQDTVAYRFQEATSINLAVGQSSGDLMENLDGTSWTVYDYRPGHLGDKQASELRDFEQIAFASGGGLLLTPDGWLAQNQALIIEGTPWADAILVHLEANGDMVQVNGEIDLTVINLDAETTGNPEQIGDPVALALAGWNVAHKDGNQLLLSHYSTVTGEQTIQLSGFVAGIDKFWFEIPSVGVYYVV